MRLAGRWALALALNEYGGLRIPLLHDLFTFNDALGRKGGFSLVLLEFLTRFRLTYEPVNINLNDSSLRYFWRGDLYEFVSGGDILIDNFF